MRYYIIDDEIGTVKTLENIVESRDLGTVVGYDTDPEQAINHILALNPDIVLVDLLMSKMDGTTLVKSVRQTRESINFVMISKVADKEMVEQAYNAGVEFFINKPINIIEVEKVLRNVADKIKMKNIVSGIKGMFSEEAPVIEKKVDALNDINIFLGLLGMMGEKGIGDILEICQYLIDHGEKYSKDVLIFIADLQKELPKNVEQRIRRAIKKGLNHVANLGIDDYSNEVFQVYGNYVFDFKNVRDEMDCIKGSCNGGGRVNIAKFIEGLLLYRQSLS